jgi:hypothetical protein
MAIKYKKWPQSTPNGHKIFRHFPFKGPPKSTQSGIFGLKLNHLAALFGEKKTGANIVALWLSEAGND